MESDDLAIACPRLLREAERHLANYENIIWMLIVVVVIEAIIIYDQCRKKP